MNIKHIDLSLIIPPTFDTRSKESPDEDFELLESIKQYGILEPILVKPSGKLFEIVFGHRRFKMCSRAGLPTIPCIIMSAGDKETELLKIHENLHRLPNSHIDQGRTFQYLRDTFKISETEIALLVNKSIAYVSQHLSILETDHNIVEAVHSDKITFSSARELIQVKNPHERKRLLDIVIENGATVDVIHNWVHQANQESEKNSGPITYVPADPTPPYRSDPTFPCESCNQIIPISHLQIIRLCPDCAFSFKNAISEIHQEAALRNTDPHIQDDPG